MRVAAYQAPLLPSGSLDAIALIATRVRWCEANEVDVLCCPEAILGGLADYAPEPASIAVRVGALDSLITPLASETVTTIVGFSERSDDGRLYNSAALVQNGRIVGLYRKRYPAVRCSVYSPGSHLPCFQADGLGFGILICNDSNYPSLSCALAAHGAALLFVPTNNGLPLDRPHAQVVRYAREVDVSIATSNHLWVIRADVAGRTTELASFGSSAIVAPDGTVVGTACPMTEDLLVAEIPSPPFQHPRGVG